MIQKRFNPTESSARTALRTQQVLAYETGVADTIDPLAGSYFVESLTDRIEAGALKHIQKIDEMGGAVKAIEQGYQQRAIQNSAFEYQKKIEEQKLIIVGVNRFTTDEPLKEALLKVNPELEVKQIKALKKLRKSRDNNAVNNALARLKKAAQGCDNLMPPILEGVKCRATLGEISNTLREVFGTYKENVVL